MKTFTHEMTSTAEPCVTRFEFAGLARVSLRTVDRMIADGDIRVVRIRRKIVRIPRAEVERYLEGKAESGN